MELISGRGPNIVLEIKRTNSEKTLESAAVWPFGRSATVITHMGWKATRYSTA